MRLAKTAIAGVVVAAAMALGIGSASAHPAPSYHWHYVQVYPGTWASCLYSPAGHLVYCSNVSSAMAVSLDK